MCRTSGDTPRCSTERRSRFGIVVLLTPAVGGMARLLGVVDQPDATAAQPAPDPAARRARDLPRASSCRRSPSSTSRARCAGSSSARPSRASSARSTTSAGSRRLPKLAGQVARGGDPDGVRRLGRPLHASRSSARSTCPAWVGVPLTIVWIVAVMNMVNFLDGMDGLASGRVRHRGRLVRRARALARTRSTPRSLARSSPAPASASCATTSSRPASSWATRVRSCSASRSPPSAVAGLLKTASTVVLFLPLLVLAIPIIDTSFVVAKRVEARQCRSTPPTVSHLHHRFVNIGFSQRRAALTMWAWCCDARGRGARDAVRALPGGRALAPLGDGRRRRHRAGALAFSVYIVYLLEIVKLANPRVRRRESELEPKPTEDPSARRSA